MSMKKTLGGDRLGSGKKMTVELHNYERSSHDLGYIWRSTMSAGTLVPFLVEVGLPGDTFDIDLDTVIKTHPTVGPLFGSFKVQLDVFHAPIRLYQGALHNNKLGIGRNMSQIKLPLIRIPGIPIVTPSFFTAPDIDTAQINPSNLLAYLGIRGVGSTTVATGSQVRDFNAVPLLAYWDIYKNYYANKQEEIGAYITGIEPTDYDPTLVETPGNTIPLFPTVTTTPSLLENGVQIRTTYPGPGTPDSALDQIILITTRGDMILSEVSSVISNNGTLIISQYDETKYGKVDWYSYRKAAANEIPTQPIRVATFPLDNIDKMREALLTNVTLTTPVIINITAGTTFLDPFTFYSNPFINLVSQSGLGVKTYNSDLFNNWLKTEWIDGPGGISEITAIDTSGGSFSIDTLNLSKKVYDMLNRIAVSGGTYDDWVDAVYTHDRFTRIESPVYHGGLIKELVFQEVVSNTTSDTFDGQQPLGTLAGKGIMSGKHKGGKIIVKIDEPSYVIGIISLTPRIDYSQGNAWHVNLKTMDDFHKPALDEIGFQELITEQMAWWSTNWNPTTSQWETRSAGKQPAWINYMTNINKTYGNFAIKTNEMFMTLNRRYEGSPLVPNNTSIKDLTTYIDPAKFNNIFAQTALDSQNFWAQIAVDMTVRRKMSAKIMPNL